MNDYRVKPKKWQPGDSGETAILWVSLNKEETKGNKLRSTAAWLDANFCNWYIDLADTLDRHNRQSLFGLSADQAETDARSAGQEWIDKQKENYAGAKNLKGVLTFDYWRTHRDFTQTFDQLLVAVDSNKTYDQAVSNDAEEFMKRRFSQGLNGQKRDELKSSGALYILEETAAAIIAAKEFQATRFYPGPQLNSIRLLREGLVKEAPPGLILEKYIEINLERRGPKIAQDNVPVLSRHIPNAKNNNG